jgi:DNA-binding NarL/FixJ family response regulator
MPELDGVEAITRIKADNQEIKFIILTTYSDDEYIFRGIAAGARAYLLKDAPREELFKAIRAVSRGESLIQPVVASRVLDKLAELSRKTPAADVLSEREIEVLRLMAKGVSNKDIADHLSITQSTVKTHITSIFQKLNVTTRTEAVTTAFKKGIIQL